MARKTRKNLVYHSPVISPNGQDVAYLSDDIGKFRIHLQEAGESKAAVIKKVVCAPEPELLI